MKGTGRGRAGAMQHAATKRACVRHARGRLLLAVVVLAVVASPGPTRAQPLVPEPSSVPPWDLLLPAFLRVGYATRAWVRDSLPLGDGTIEGDVAIVDVIYLRALGEADGDPELALAGALFAVFEHPTIPLRAGIELPLTLEPADLFDRRVARLPRRLFADRPGDDDRDKLQHFFASALLTRNLDSPELADLVGKFVEWGEDAFIRGGVSDPRDVRANRLGQLFAELLVADPHMLPGALFRAWNRRYSALVAPR